MTTVGVAVAGKLPVPASLPVQPRPLIRSLYIASSTGLADLDKLVPVLKKLGAKHKGYNVLPAHCE